MSIIAQYTEENCEVSWDDRQDKMRSEPRGTTLHLALMRAPLKEEGRREMGADGCIFLALMKHLGREVPVTHAWANIGLGSVLKDGLIEKADQGDHATSVEECICPSGVPIQVETSRTAHQRCGQLT